MSRQDLYFRLRIPPTLKEKVKNAATRSTRSMTAEIVHRLQESFAARISGQVFRSDAGSPQYFRTVELKTFPDNNGLTVGVWEATPVQGGKTKTHVAILGVPNGWEDVLVLTGRGGPITECALETAEKINAALAASDGSWPGPDFSKQGGLVQ